MTAPVYPQQYPTAWPQQFQQPQAPAQYPPQQFAPGYPAPTPAAPAVQLAQGSIDDFYNQPSAGGGAALKFEAIGQTYTGIVTRPITSADIQQQTDTLGRPQTFRDGRPKFVMKVPLQLQPTPDRPDGLAQWYVKGQARDELVRAMAEAGAPAGAPEPGAIIQVTYVSQRASGPGMNPAKQFHVVYTRPDGQTSSPAPAVQAPVAQQPTAFAQAAAPDLAALQAQQAAQLAAAQAAQAAAVPQQAPAQPASPAAPTGMSPEQQELLARLTGQKQG